MAVPVIAEPASTQTVAHTLSLVGSLEANEVVEIKSEIDGAIEAIRFEEGQPVNKGQLLIQIDGSKLRAMLAQAQANLSLAETTRERYKGLIEAGGVSRQEFDEAMSKYESSRAAVALVQEQLRDASIEAPFDGIVGARQLSVGQFVTPGTALTWLIDPDPIKVEFRVPERYVGQVKADQLVEVRVDPFPDASFRGKVYFVDPQIDPGTRTALVKAIVPNPDGQLRRGMFASVALTVGQHDGAVVIAETAIVHNDQSTSVYVIENGQAQPRPVQLGARLPGHVEVVEGLAPGEMVVTEGIQKLRPGAQVAVHPPESDPTTPKTPAPTPPSAR